MTKELTENQVIGELIELEKYRFVDHQIIAEVVMDVYLMLEQRKRKEKP